VDAGAAAGRAIARVEFRPGNRRLLRGAMLFAAANGKTSWIGGWSPWQHAVVPPSQNAFQIPPGATLVVELYYRGADAELTDGSSIDLTFAPQTAAGPIDDIALEARDATGSRLHGVVRLTRAARVWALHPDLLPSIASMELIAERPDKSTEVLMWIPTARPEWPLALVMQEPVSLPAGSTVSLAVETRGPLQPGSWPRVTMSVLR
jgi:hypothetical protein